MSKVKETRIPEAYSASEKLSDPNELKSNENSNFWKLQTIADY